MTLFFFFRIFAIIFFPFSLILVVRQFFGVCGCSFKSLMLKNGKMASEWLKESFIAKIGEIDDAVALLCNSWPEFVVSFFSVVGIFEWFFTRNLCTEILLLIVANI